MNSDAFDCVIQKLLESHKHRKLSLIQTNLMCIYMYREFAIIGMYEWSEWGRQSEWEMAMAAHTTTRQQYHNSNIILRKI